MHSPGGRTFLREMTSWPRHVESMTSNRKSDSANRCVYSSGTIVSNFINPIWKDGAYRLKSGRLKKNKMSSDMRSVPGLIIYLLTHSLTLSFIMICAI